MTTGLLVLPLVIVAGVLLRPLFGPFGHGFAAPMVLVGFLVSEAIVLAGGDTGLRWQHIEGLVFGLLVPGIVYHCAYQLTPGAVASQRRIFLLTPLSWALGFFLIAAILYFGIGVPSGFPWVAAFLAASILMAPEPGPLVDQIRNDDSRAALEGEAVISDVFALTAFAVLLAAASGDSPSPLTALRVFFLAGLGGLAVGAVAALFVFAVGRAVEDARARAVAPVLLAYGAYQLAEGVLGVSGVVAVAAVAMAARAIDRRWPPRGIGRGGGRHFVAAIGFLAGATLFLLLGATTTLDMFAERWVAMILAIGAVVVGRLAQVYAVPGPWLPPGGRMLLMVGGIRTTVVAALALMLPTSLPYWWTIQAMAYGVVVFSLAVQLPLGLALLARRRPRIT